VGLITLSLLLQTLTDICALGFFLIHVLLVLAYSSLVVLAFVYFVGGFIFLRFVKHREGGDAIPNREFWADLPGLVKDGIMFVINKIRGTPSSYETVA
jgi:hypothetical protein